MQELRQRRARIAATASGAAEDQQWEDFFIRGTCQELEKSYFRLTAVPDPASVRPEPVLRRALNRLVALLAKPQGEAVKYLYAMDQLKVGRCRCTDRAGVCASLTWDKLEVTPSARYRAALSCSQPAMLQTPHPVGLMVHTQFMPPAARHCLCATFMAALGLTQLASA